MHPWVSRRLSLDWLFDGMVAALLVSMIAGSLWPLLPLVVAVAVALRQWVRGRHVESGATGVVALIQLLAWDSPEVTALLTLVVLTFLFREMTIPMRVPPEEESQWEHRRLP